MITALVGGQFGSEGKGLIAGHIAQEFDAHVRVGAANAGHTLYTDIEPSGLAPEDALHAEKHVMQQLPCAAYANPAADLFIGPGALISPEILYAELDLNHAWREARGLPPAMVYIDRRAHVITEEQIEAEQLTDLAERIGSTSTIAREGIGVAAADRVLRAERCCTAQLFFGDEDPEDVPLPIYLTDVPSMLARRGNVLLEGTQGTGLSNVTGFFPYTTSRCTTAAGLAADCGVPPQIDRVILVCRTFPIRVAGNSGPFHEGSEETSWAEVGIDPEKERTTVTKKVRRVATLSMEQIVEAVRLNGASEIALTFADYIDPNIAQMSGKLESNGERTLKRFPKVWSLIEEIQEATTSFVRYIGTGPHHVLERESWVNGWYADAHSRRLLEPGTGTTVE